MHNCQWIKKNTCWATKKRSWICRLCTLWCSNNSPCVDNFCKNAYFSFWSKSDEVKLNVSSNSRSCDMSGSGGNVSSSHLYPRNLWCVMAKYATQGNVQIPLPRSKAQRFSQSKLIICFPDSFFLCTLQPTKQKSPSQLCCWFNFCIW